VNLDTKLSPVDDLTFQEVTLYAHLVDILTFFVRQHLFRTRNSIQSESLAPRVAQLLTAPQKHLKLGKTWLIINMTPGNSG
jgi:protein phosphatase-4 regulatory subunit 3